MNNISPSSGKTSDFLLKLLISALFLGVVFVAVTGQTSIPTPAPPPGDCPPSYPVACATPDPKTQKETWPQGANVTVNIDPSFSPAQRAAIQHSFTNWQTAGTNNGSGVTFTFTQNANPPSMTPPPGTYNAQVWHRVHLWPQVRLGGR